MVELEPNCLKALKMTVEWEPNCLKALQMEHAKVLQREWVFPKAGSRVLHWPMAKWKALTMVHDSHLETLMAQVWDLPCWSG